MNKNDEIENIKGKRILLAGASVFLIMPIFLFLLEKVISSFYEINNPKLLIGLIVGGAVLIDYYFVKHLKEKLK